MRKRRVLLSVVLFSIFGLFAGNAQAGVLFPVYGISDGSPTNKAIGENQIFIDVDNGESSVIFTFYNIGPTMSTITDVYFDDGTLLALTGLIDADDGIGGDPDVDFSSPASPSNLPDAGLMLEPFVASLGFSADADTPPPTWGVSPGQSLGVVFSLTSGNIDDVLQELLDETLRIGIHVQNFNGSGGSESFVNQPIPEPATILLLGLGGLLFRKRKA